MAVTRETVPISKLKAAPYNPRTISEEARAGLRRSIERFGLVQEVVVNRRSGNVVGGHKRLAEAKALGQKEVPVVWVDLDENDEKALNVALNSPAIAGQFTDSLQGLLSEIQAQDAALYDALRLGELEWNPVDIDAEWDGMPEFLQTDKTAFQSIVVNFQDQDAIDAFATAIGQKIGRKTRSIWFPLAAIESMADKHYAAES